MTATNTCPLQGVWWALRIIAILVPRCCGRRFQVCCKCFPYSFRFRFKVSSFSKLFDIRGAPGPVSAAVTENESQQEVLSSPSVVYLQLPWEPTRLFIRPIMGTTHVCLWIPPSPAMKWDKCSWSMPPERHPQESPCYQNRSQNPKSVQKPSLLGR